MYFVRSDSEGEINIFQALNSVGTVLVRYYFISLILINYPVRKLIAHFTHGKIKAQKIMSTKVTK